MALHPLAEQFASVAGAYERGRPDYPPAVAGAITAELGVAAGEAVLDLGAGTGKLTRALLAAGVNVVAVEPQPELRELLASAVGAERALEGLAEAIPLADGSVAAVTIADAFHWFDQPRALPEIRRVLRAGGGLALLSAVPDWGGATWAHELGQLMSRARPAHPHFDGLPWREALRAAGGFGEPWEIRVTSAQGLAPARIVDYLVSISWVAAMPEREHADFLARAQELVLEGEAPAELSVHFVILLSRRVEGAPDTAAAA
jgi:SAM-dependent methyltransferase